MVKSVSVTVLDRTIKMTLMAIPGTCALRLLMQATPSDWWLTINHSPLT
jgi:hypothetical protein